MSPASKIRTGLVQFKKGMEAGELLPYSVDYYRESITGIRKRLDRFERFALNELNHLADENDQHEIDWDIERGKMVKKLDRWLREANGVIHELAILVQDVREDQAILKEFVLVRSGKHSE